jgi:hypothetical protein
MVYISQKQIALEPISPVYVILCYKRRIFFVGYRLDLLSHISVELS